MSTPARALRTFRDASAIALLLVGAASTAGAQVVPPPTLVADIHPGTSSGPLGSGIALVRRMGSRAYFFADDGVHGRELWTSDGTAAGTSLVIDLQPGAASTTPKEMVVFRDRLIFDAGDPFVPANVELWSSDGTAAGTAKLLEINPTPPPPIGTWSSSFPEQLTVADDLLFFVALDGVHGFELWRTDATTAGTAMVADQVVEPGGWTGSFARPKIIGTAGDRVFYVWQAHEPGVTDTGMQIFASDGTAAGTAAATDLDMDLQSGGIGWNARVMGDRVFFPFATEALGYELWQTDGTIPSTGPVLDLNPGAASSYAQKLRLFGDRLLFWADAGTSTFLDLWITDGTSAGTQLLWAQPPGAATVLTTWADAGPTAQFGGPLAYFHEGFSSGPQTLWRTDGTPVGTFPVHSFDLPVHAIFTDIALGTVGEEGHFAVASADPVSGVELWIADGTATGTFALADTNPGTGDGIPTDVLRIGDRLLFVADDGAHGRELHAVPFVATGAFDAVAHGAGCTSLAEEPAIGWSGSFALGGSAAVTVKSVSSFAPALLFWSTQRATVPLGSGCTLYLASPQLFATVVTNGHGAGSKSVALPSSPSLAGIVLPFQWAVVEVGGPVAGIAGLSDALELVVGP